MNKIILFFISRMCPKCRLQEVVMRELAEEGYGVMIIPEGHAAFDLWHIDKVPSIVIPLEEDGSRHIILNGIKSKETLKEYLGDWMLPPKTQNEEPG